MAMNSPTITRRTALLGTPAFARADATRADEGGGL